MKTLKIIKIGGNIIDDPSELEDFLIRFSKIDGPKVLVHGGGKTTTALSEKIGLTVKMIDGRRITDEKTLDVAVQVYAGLINKKLVAKLQGYQCNAIGLSGADMNIIPAEKRKIETIDFGFVGDFRYKNINTEHLNLLIEAGITPVFCAITHDSSGQLLNTNADTIASGLAIALSAHYQIELSFCFDKKGVLEDVNNDDSVLSQLNWMTYLQLKESGEIHEGMIPKLENAFYAKNNGVKSISIKHAKNAFEQSGTELSL
jgi:acetylglutamate kinase